jgi:uncharacterized protein
VTNRPDHRASSSDHRDDAEKRAARCPICDTTFPRDRDSFPFCSPKCRMVDLGHWLAGRYTVSREIADEDDLDLPTDRAPDEG